MNKFKRLISKNNKQGGFSLLEVMIALIVSNIALLGLVSGELKSLQYANNSYQYTVSLIQANNITDRILNDVCTLTGENFSQSYIDNTLSPIAGYTLSGISDGDAFKEALTVTISWVDKRMDDQSTNQIQISPNFPLVPAGCSIL